MKKIAILASGSGSNAENIVNYLRKKEIVVEIIIISNKEDAFVHQRAKKLNLKSIYFPKSDFENGCVLKYVQEKGIDFIILAGFLLKIPANLIAAYPNKIINIHPALLPKYGGKGMYGDHVHKAVIEAHESESGITIHYVNEHYDEGGIIFQAKCELTPADTYETLAHKIHELEYKYFPEIVENLIY